MDRMTESLIFLQALLDHLDHLEELLEEDWPVFQQRLQNCLDRMAETEDETALLLWVDEISGLAGRDSLAASLIRTLFRQAQAEAAAVLERTMVAGGPSTESKELSGEISFTLPTQPPDDPSPGSDAPTGRADILAFAANLSQALRTDEAVSSPPAGQRIQTYPNLQGDDYAYLKRPYQLLVKLSDQLQAGTGDHISVPELEVPVEPGQAVKQLQVKLRAPDFELAPTESDQGWLRPLNFYVEAAASGMVTFTLLAQDRFAERYFAGLKLQFLADGQILGEASRRMEVLQAETVSPTPLNAFPPAPGYPLDEKGEVRLPAIPTPVTFTDDSAAVHLTVTIEEGQTPDQLLWDIVSPYLEQADYPPDPYLSRNLGAEEFVKEYLAPFGMPGDWPEDHMDMEGHLKRLSVNMLFSNLITLRRSAPVPFWQLYDLALARHLAGGGTPEAFTILFRTADTHIPWELMPVSEAVQDGKMAPLLGSAHCVGRWLLEVGHPMPDARLDLHGFTLATPTYSDDSLLEAQAEKTFLQATFGPRTLADDAETFINFMVDGQPTNGTGILHFAGHGDCCTDTMRRNWLVLTNRQALYDINNAGTDLGNRLGKLGPTLAFFNACNVGRAAKGPLGSNGGWGRALLHQQYKSYIGPLWSVYDKHARDISQTFYTLALKQGLPLGEVMRQIRDKFRTDNRLFTYLAYLYLGHPLAQIKYTPFEGDNV